MKGKICLCPESIQWIKKHLLKSAKAKFAKMITVGSIKKVIDKKTKKKLKAGIHFVTINGVERKVKVLKNGQWRFMAWMPKYYTKAGKRRPRGPKRTR